MKEIPLTKGYVAIVDDENFEWLSKYKWQASFTKPNSCYAKTVKNKTRYYMHRLIMNTPSNMICDHINRNTLDNRVSNLRNCTIRENSMNRIGNVKNRTGYKNISLTKENTYCVQVMINRKHVFRKIYKTLQEAIKARDEQLAIHHGEFANTDK